MDKAKVKPRDSESGSSTGPKGGALSVSADEVVSGSDGGTVKEGRGMKTGHTPSTRETDSGGVTGTKEGRGMVGEG